MKNDRVINPNTINPVDFFNKNHLELTLVRLLQIKNVEQSGDTSITYVKNRSDINKRMIIIDKQNCTFTAEMENGLGMKIGEKYTPFMMLQKYVYKGCFKSTLSYVVYELMNNNNDYVRIGTKYFQRIKKTDRWGIERHVLTYWERATLVDDYGRDFLNNVEKFKYFGMKPDNKKFQLKIDGEGYNLYKEFSHKAMPVHEYKGDEQWKWTKTLLQHIFGEHYAIGLVYMKALYLMPEQMLPILVLLSQERQTGKTTFVNWMTLIFGENSVIINPEDIKSGFNAPYAEKNVIMIEESHFDSRQALEKIKNLATQKKMLVNSKFIQQYEIEFFGKIIITSNDENKFSKVDDEEIRYWIRKIPTLQGKANHNIEQSLRDEIPAFLCFLEIMHTIEGDWTKYLNEDGTIDKGRSRMIFTKEELQTDALTAVKKESRESLHKDIELYLEAHGMQNSQVEEFSFGAIHIKDKWFSHNSRFTTSYVNRVLKHNMKLDKSDKIVRFIPLEENNDARIKTPGRPYVYKNPYYNIDDVDNLDDGDPGVPF